MQASALRIADAPHLHGVRVLVVDDMPYVRDVVTEILERGGAIVTAVGTAEEALEVLQRERPTVLLSDLSMPGKGRLLADRAGSRAPTGARRDHPRGRPDGLHRPRAPRQSAACGGPVPRGEARQHAGVDRGGGDPGVEGIRDFKLTENDARSEEHTSELQS